jgi:hypothetical protein
VPSSKTRPEIVALFWAEMMVEKKLNISIKKIFFLKNHQFNDQPNK